MDIQKNHKEHMLKTDPAVFQDVLDGSKTFEIRFNDRGYQIGDLIVLKETKFTGQQMKSGQPLAYTGREIQKRISYVLGGYGLQDDWVILGVQDIEATKAQAVPEDFVLVPKDQFESLNEFKALYKRAIINARKRKDQLNWAHVAGLGVGSGRAVELCKMLNIDPCATNMHEVIEAQEQSHE